MISCFKRLIIFCIFSFLIVVFISNSSLIVNSLTNSFNIFYNSILFSVYPYLVLVDYLINYGYLNIFNHLHLKSFSFFILCVFSSLPTNAYIINKLYDNGKIKVNHVYTLLSFSSLPNIIITIYFVGNVLLKNTYYGFIIYFSVLLANIIMYVFNYRYIDNITFDFDDKLSFSNCLRVSLIKNAKNMLVIFGSISLFNLIIDIICYYFSLDSTITIILNSFLEMSSALIRVSSTNIPIICKCVFMSFILSFNGICILIQQASILNINNFNYYKVLKNKIFVSIISSFISYLLLYF